MSVLLMAKLAGPVVLKHAVPALMAKAVGTISSCHVFFIYFVIVIQSWRCIKNLIKSMFFFISEETLELWNYTQGKASSINASMAYSVRNVSSS